MSKLDQYMQGRTEGMEFALRLAKDKGIEELEKEVRFRNRTGVSLNLTRQEIAAGSWPAACRTAEFPRRSG